MHSWTVIARNPGHTYWRRVAGAVPVLSAELAQQQLAALLAAEPTVHATIVRTDDDWTDVDWTLPELVRMPIAAALDALIANAPLIAAAHVAEHHTPDAPEHLQLSELDPGELNDPPAPCQCESDDCTHPYLGVPAGEQRADYVGPVCDACATSHLAPYVEPEQLAQLVVIPCGGQKLDHAAPAAQLYTGGYFRSCLAYALAVTDGDASRIRILSARYGLLRLDDWVHPYEQRMDQPGHISVDALRDQQRRQGLVDVADVRLVGGRAYVAVGLQLWPDAVDVLAGVGGLGYQRRELGRLAADAQRDNFRRGQL